MVANVAKSKTMNCCLGPIRLGIPKEVFVRSSNGEVATYQEHLSRCVPCPECGGGDDSRIPEIPLPLPTCYQSIYQLVQAASNP